jgi:hypothetical protein
VWDRYSKLSQALSLSESLALSAEVTEVVVGAGRGKKAERVLFPPAPTAIEWVRQVDESMTQELELKLRLVEVLVSTDTGPESPARLSRAARIWCLQPGLHRVAVERLALVVGSLTLEDAPSETL